MASRHLLASLLLAGIPVFGTATAQESTLPELAARTTPAVVLIRVLDADGRQTAVASGFLVEDGRVVTNAHVVTGANRLDLFGHEGQALGSAWHAEAIDAARDLAVLPRVEVVPATLRLASEQPRVGETILAIGAPEGLSHTVSNGIVSAVRSLEGREVIQITAPLSSGSSGGPVVNGRGEVIGVSVGMFRRGQNLNFAVPVQPLHALLESQPARLAFSASGERRRVRAATQPEPLRSLPRSLPRVEVGASVRGALDVDSHLVNGKLALLYRFRGTAGETVVLTLRSVEFDAYLEVGSISDEGARTIARDDDGGGGTDARIVFTPPSDGEYLVLVTSYQEAEVGRFTLTLEPAPLGNGRRAAAGALR
jgi:hypothetical protein